MKVERIMRIKDKDRTPVAKDLVTRCARCNLELSHVVVVHNLEGVVDRVKCKTCGSEHKYRPNKKKAPSKAPNKSKTRSFPSSHLRIQVEGLGHVPHGPGEFGPVRRRTPHVPEPFRVVAFLLEPLSGPFQADLRPKAK